MGRGVLLNEAKSCQIALLVLENYDHRLGSLQIQIATLGPSLSAYTMTFSKFNSSLFFTSGRH